MTKMAYENPQNPNISRTQYNQTYLEVIKDLGKRGRKALETEDIETLESIVGQIARIEMARGKSDEECTKELLRDLRKASH